MIMTRDEVWSSRVWRETAVTNRVITMFYDIEMFNIQVF